MKRQIFILILSTVGIVNACLAADCPAEVTTSMPSMYRQELLGFRKHVTFSNALNFYRIDYTQWKSHDATPPKINLALQYPLEYHNFSRPLGSFLRMTVNGISEVSLHPKEEDVTLWNDARTGAAGCDIAWNFDGAKLILRWFMRSDSPVLWLTIKSAPDLLTPIKSAHVKVSVVPSLLAQTADKKVLWEGVYGRQVITPTRIIGQVPKPQFITLTPDDRYLIFQDTKFDGSNGDKGTGPCFMAIDYQGVEKAVLTLRDEGYAFVDIDLKPDFKTARLGFWQQKDRHSNAEFAKVFNAKLQTFEMALDKGGSP